MKASYTLAQNLESGQTFVHGKHGRTGDLLVSVLVSFRGTVQSGALGIAKERS